MTAKTSRTIGNILLAIGIIILVVNICGMLGWITRPWPSRETTLAAFVFVVAARGFRRRRDPVAPPVA